MKEFKLAFSELDLNLKASEVEDMYYFIDRNKDGVIKIDEFVAVMVKSQ